MITAVYMDGGIMLKNSKVLYNKIKLPTKYFNTEQDTIPC